jgi:hypothetical protein
MVDRLIHHAELISLKGDSYRLKDRDLGPRPSCQSAESARPICLGPPPRAAEALTTRRPKALTLSKSNQTLRWAAPARLPPFAYGSLQETVPQPLSRGVNSQPALTRVDSVVRRIHTSGPKHGR